MMNKITIHGVAITDTRIECTYSIEGKVSEYFTPHLFFVEYSASVGRTPLSVAVIPFLCQALPVAWVYDAEIDIPELDKDFYEAIPRFKEGYIHMYPKIKFMGKINARKIVKNTSPQKDRSVIFFSGGVDAHQTVIEHIDKNPVLATIWGSDIDIENKDGWARVESHAKQTAAMLSLELITIRSSFRKIINEESLSKFVFPLANDGWWHGFQHGIGLIGHIAPYAFCHGITTAYISSSFTKSFQSTCASDPTIDNYVKFCGCQTVHNGYEFERQEKVHQICDFHEKTGKPISLRVCWESTDGGNCCSCEKCYRTILSIIAEKKDPRDFAFYYDDKDFPKIMKRIKLFFAIRKVPYHHYYYYFYTQSVFRKNYSENTIDKNLLWFYNYDFDRFAKKKQSFREFIYFVSYQLILLPIRVFRKARRCLKW